MESNSLIIINRYNEPSAGTPGGTPYPRGPTAQGSHLFNKLRKKNQAHIL